MSAEPDNDTLNIAAAIGYSIAIARQSVSSESEAIVKLITDAQGRRKRRGTNTRKSLTGLREAALAQVKLASAALEIFEICSDLANGAALAAPSVGAAH
jgi:hypothetical protein